ncbi:MAG: YtxH domain-containing protein [Candidatus Acidiferrum sp.]
MTRESKTGTILSFVLGAAAGAVTALLLAPKSGAELRGEIAEGINDGVSQVRSSGKDLKHRAQKLVNSAKASVEDAVDAGQVAYDRAKSA